MASISEAMDQIIYVGIGIFVLVLILSLTYQGYGQSQSQLLTQYCNHKQYGADTYNCIGANDLGSGVTQNYSKYSGPLPNTFGGALQLAVFALVFIAVILAVVGALRGGGVGGSSGGFLGR